ncbi:hypothetical protein HPB50_016659 [Hyalomma asiaticum]|uniref:Uncharacterized protein n=1 Tax=Hyalomma asiaticum TaxID=266040 RepID=A0ACB7TLJ0_HYAAI|nr:hypothetical protein HPB50_016659 [Hyalomma asiaticum]
MRRPRLTRRRTKEGAPRVAKRKQKEAVEGEKKTKGETAEQQPSSLSRRQATVYPSKRRKGQCYRAPARASTKAENDCIQVWRPIAAARVETKGDEQST